MVKYLWALLACLMMSQANAAYIHVGGQKIEYYREVAVPDMVLVFTAWRNTYHAKSTTLIVARNSVGELRLRKIPMHVASSSPRG